MPNYTIHCIGFDQAQQSTIAAILDLADSALTHSWTMVESGESDIVIINMPDEEGRQLDSQYNNLAKYRIILVAENFHERFQNYWFLEKKDHSPPSLRVFVDLLNQVGVCLIEAAASEPVDKQEVFIESSAELQKKIVESSPPDDPKNKEQIDEGEAINIDIAADSDTLKDDKTDKPQREQVEEPSVLNNQDKEQKDDLVLQITEEEAINIDIAADSDMLKDDKTDKPQREQVEEPSVLDNQDKEQKDDLVLQITEEEAINIDIATDSDTLKDDKTDKPQREQVEEPSVLDSQENKEQKNAAIQMFDDDVFSNSKASSRSDKLKDEKPNKPQRKLLKKNYFFGILLQASKEKKYSLVRLDELPPLYLASADNGYYFSGSEDELSQYCLVMPHKLNIKILSRAKFNKAIKTKFSKLVLKELKSLINYAIIHASQGHLLEEHSAKQRLTLKEMPDVKKDSILRPYKDIAELMFHEEGTLFDVADKLQVSLSNVFDFYNVSYLQGNIHMFATKPKDKDTENNKTLGRFLKSFFIK